MKDAKEIENELLLKEKRARYWERYHSIPTMFDIQTGGVVL